MSASSFFATRRALIVAAAVVGAAVLTGCASLSSKPEDIVRKRAQERWDAMLKGDFERAYGYLTPGARAAVPYSMFRGRIGGAVTWQGATVDTVECETLEKCTAVVRVSFTMPVRRSSLGTIESGVEETWLLEDGQWWFLYKP